MQHPADDRGRLARASRCHHQQRPVFVSRGHCSLSLVELRQVFLQGLNPLQCGLCCGLFSEHVPLCLLLLPYLLPLPLLFITLLLCTLLVVVMVDEVVVLLLLVVVILVQLVRLVLLLLLLLP